jgi:hypothetical protein
MKFYLVMQNNVDNSDQAKFQLLVTNDSISLKERLELNLHFTEEKERILKVIQESSFDIEVQIHINIVTHHSNNFFQVKLNLLSPSFDNYSLLLEGTDYLDLINANVKKAVHFIRERKEKLNSKH